jgi:hypothetical protein
MITVEKNITPKGKNFEQRMQIRDTLLGMEPGDSFVIDGDIKKGTVKSVSIAANIKVKIAEDANGKLRCWKV